MHPRKNVSSIKQSFVFNKNEFDHIISQYDKFELSCRIDNVIVKHAKKWREKYTFYLNWPVNSKSLHPLKVTFSRADHFDRNYSWIMDEKNLLREFPNVNQKDIKPEQCYYSLSVKEVIDSKKLPTKTKNNEIEILSFWLAMDGLVGELRDLKKGHEFSGNDVLSIYSYFNQIFKIKNTLICDESRLEDETEHVRIPLRLISLLCTGQTWYQTKLPGVKLFECEQFKSARNGIVTQHSDKLGSALKELQQLRLSEWYEMLNDSAKRTLKKLYHQSSITGPAEKRKSLRLFVNKENKNQLTFAQANLQDLVIVLFNDSKAKRTITPHLEDLTNLLCARLHWEEDMELDPDQADFWFKSRVKEVLWGGYFWVKEATDPEQFSAPKESTTAGLACT